MAVSKTKKELVYRKYNGHCAYCGRPITRAEMQVDHMVPIRRGTSQAQIDRFNQINVEQIQKGTGDLSNLMPACPACNRLKGEKTLDKFRMDILAEAKSSWDKLKSGRAKNIIFTYNLINFTPHQIEFFFEKYNENNNSK